MQVYFVLRKRPYTKNRQKRFLPKKGGGSYSRGITGQEGEHITIARVLSREDGPGTSILRTGAISKREKTSVLLDRTNFSPGKGGGSDEGVTPGLQRGEKSLPVVLGGEKGKRV